MLQNSRLQAQKKSQAESENQNGSNVDDADCDDNNNDDDDVDNERKSFRERISDRLNRLKELDKDLDGPDDQQADETTQGHDKTVPDGKIPTKAIEVSEASCSDRLTSEDLTQDTQDNLNDTNMQCEAVGSTIIGNSEKSVLPDIDTKIMEETNTVDLHSEYVEKKNDEAENTVTEELLNQTAVNGGQTSVTSAAEIKILQSHEKDNWDINQEGVLYDWEKPDCCDKDFTSEKEQSTEATIDNVTESEDKENQRENSGDASMLTKRTEGTVSPVKKSSPTTKSEKKLKKEKLLALAGIDLNVMKPCLSGETESFISLVEEETAPQHPGIVNLMDRLTKHNAKREKKHSKDLDIRYLKSN